MSKTQFMIAHGATVTVVRDGKRVPIMAGSGFDFTEDEIAAANKGHPGALRKPINESVARAKTKAEEPADDAAGDADTGKGKKKAAKPLTAKQQKAADKAKASLEGAGAKVTLK